MRETDQLAVQLPPDIERETDLEILRIVRQSVQANDERDSDLYLLRQQLEGISVPAGNFDEINSCLLEDPISREMHTTAHANVMAAFRQKPYVTLTALDPKNDDATQRVETLGNAEAELFGFDGALDAAVYHALESRFAVMGIFYRTTTTKQKIVQAADPVEAFDAEERGELPEQQLYNKVDTTEAFEFVPIKSWDFYLNPPGANEVARADHTIERIWLTKSALEDGIRDAAFIEANTRLLIKNGPTAVVDGDQPRDQQMSLNGINEVQASFYECFRVVGRMPALPDSDGKPRTPDEFMAEDFLWLVCPAHNIVFKRTFSPFPIRPYAVGKAIGDGTELIGHGIVSMVSAIQDEMTIILRSVVDSVNRTVRPRFKIPKKLKGWYSTNDNRSSDYLVYSDDPREVDVVPYNLQGIEIGVNVMQFLYGRAAQITAAQGVNSMLAGKVRKAAEVDFTAEVVQNKFGLILANMQKMVKEIFRIYFALRKYHLNAEAVVRSGDVAVVVTRDDLDTEFRIVPHADADNASSQLRLQNDMALTQVLRSSPLYQQMLAVGDMAPEWILISRILGHMGIQNVQAFIGQMPTPGDPMFILQRLVMTMQQAAAAGHPDAPQVIQFIQQMMAQGNPQMAQAQGVATALQSQAVPGAGLTLPAAPAQAGGTQAAMNGVGHGFH